MGGGYEWRLCRRRLVRAERLVHRLVGYVGEGPAVPCVSLRVLPLFIWATRGSGYRGEGEADPVFSPPRSPFKRSGDGLFKAQRPLWAFFSWAKDATVDHGSIAAVSQLIPVEHERREHRGRPRASLDGDVDRQVTPSCGSSSELVRSPWHGMCQTPVNTPASSSFYSVPAAVRPTLPM